MLFLVWRLPWHIVPLCIFPNSCWGFVNEEQLEMGAYHYFLFSVFLFPKRCSHLIFLMHLSLGSCFSTLCEPVFFTAVPHAFALLCGFLVLVEWPLALFFARCIFRVQVCLPPRHPPATAPEHAQVWPVFRRVPSVWAVCLFAPSGSAALGVLGTSHPRPASRGILFTPLPLDVTSLSYFVPVLWSNMSS